MLKILFQCLFYSNTENFVLIDLFSIPYIGVVHMLRNLPHNKTCIKNLKNVSKIQHNIHTNPNKQSKLSISNWVDCKLFKRFSNNFTDKVQARLFDEIVQNNL